MSSLPPGFELDEPAGGKPPGTRRARQTLPPFAAPQNAADGRGIAYFGDEPTPPQPLRPEVERAYLSLAQNPQSTSEDLISFAKEQGFQLDPANVAQFVSKRNAGAQVGSEVRYRKPVAPIVDGGGGATGSFARGVADPINFVDELGGISDTLTGRSLLERGSQRPNIFDSPDARFGDLLWQNIDRNRSVLAYDEAKHPWARFGGQVASGVLVPTIGAEGVAAQAFRKAISEGASRMAARTAARKAVVQRMAAVGAVEGGVAGAGAGEAGIGERLPSAIAGAGIGAVAGPVLGLGAESIGRLVRNARRPLNESAQSVDALAADTGEQIGKTEVDNVRADAVSAPSGFVLDGEPRSAGMPPKGMAGPAMGDLPEGFVIDEQPPLPTGGRNPAAQVANDFDRQAAIEALDSATGRQADALQEQMQREQISEDAAFAERDPTSPRNIGRRAVREQVADLMGAVSPEDRVWIEQRIISGVRGNRQADIDSAVRMIRAGWGDAVPNAPRAGMSMEGMGRATVAAPESFVPNDPVSGGRPLPMSGRATPEQIASIAEGTPPASVLPIPRNEIASLDEAMRANPGPRQLVPTPNERDALPTYRINDRGPARRDPLDLVGWARTQGGLQDTTGDLRHLGIGNEPRGLEFTNSERFLGKLVREDGMSLDDAAIRAWEQGYFPDRLEPPTSTEFLDALEASFKGGSGRLFHPDDYAALDAYRAAQMERNAIERADQEGRPMVQDVGQPVTADDLDAIRPPVTAYEDLRALGGTIGNINVAKLGSREDIGRALQTVDNRFGGFDAARRGQISQAETEALASELGMTADDLLKRRRGQALNAEQALAARAILAKSGDELVRLARSAQGGSDDALAAFRAGLVRHAAIQEQVAGATAEAGRALAQFRMEAKGSLARGRQLKSILESGGGRDRLEDVARKIIDLDGDPSAVNKFVEKAAKPGAWDMAKEYWINSLLSGPRTHFTNIGSNMLTAVWSIPEHALTATIGKALRSPDAMTYRDVGARVVGMIEGARDGLRLARRAFMTGEPSDGISQIEAQNYRAIPGKLGSVIRTPTRALMAEDEFFKSIAYRGELNALAAREALSKGLPAAERAKLFAELRDNPSDAMIDKAVKAARYQTFQAPLKGPGVQIQMLANKGPMKLFLPFVRTPLNLLKYATERSPLAPVLSEFRDAIRAGGMARDQALARVGMGSGLAALAVAWGLEGRLSGSGPADPREREALQNTGWQPFSIKVGDTWYSYQRIDPFARLLSTAADFATFGDYMSEKEREDVARSLSIAIARNISTMPTLDPAASAFEALSDPDRYLTRYARNLAASAAVPNLITQTNTVIDPYMRETETLMDTIKSRVPVLSRQLPARVNMWGEPVERGDALGPDILSPIWEKPERNDKALSEIARLRVGLSRPDRSVGDIRLNATQYADLMKAGGQPAKQMLDVAIGSPQWGRLTDGMKRLVIRRMVERSREAASRQMLMGNPDLLRAQVAERLRRKMGER